VRRRISSPEMTFERIRTPEPEQPPAGSVDQDLETAFDALATGASPDEDGAGDQGKVSLGRIERRAFELALPGRTVERIVDLSRYGEFETSKALQNLVNLGYLRAVAPEQARTGTVGAYARSLQHRSRTWLVRGATTGVIAVALAGLALWVDHRGQVAGQGGGAIVLRDNLAPRYLARYQLARLRGALDVFRVEKGQYPERLEELVDAGLVSWRDLRRPWSQPYHYRRRAEGGFVLLSPLE